MAATILTDAFFASMESSVLDVNRAQTLPPACHTSPEFYEFEKDAVFAHEWLCVGREAWIKEPGDYFTSMHIGEPIVIVRLRDGSIGAMSTVCQHRGMLVAEGRGNAKSFLCAYHHWVYGLDGQLIGAPAMERACDFDKSAIRLPRFAVEVWLGFIFIHFDRDAAPLAPRLRALEAVLRNYDLADGDESPTSDSNTYPWNWKVNYENNNDGYHANRLHAGPYHDNVPSELSVFPDLPDDSAGYYRFNGTLHPDLSFNPTMRAVLPIFPKLTAEDRNRMVFANVPPSLTLTIRSDMVAYRILQANSHDTITALRGWIVARGATRDPLFYDKLNMNLAASREIQNQDLHVDERVQIGLRSRFAARGRYSWQEQAQREFNTWLVKRYRAGWDRRKAQEAEASHYEAALS